MATATKKAPAKATTKVMPRPQVKKATAAKRAPAKATATKAPAKKAAPAAKAATTTKPKVEACYTIDGRDVVLNRDVTLSYIAWCATKGLGKGGDRWGVEQLRDFIESKGVKDVTAPGWLVELPNHKKVGLRAGKGVVTPRERKQRSASRRSGSLNTLQALKAEAASVKAWKESGSKGAKPETPVTDQRNAEIAARDAKAKAEVRKARGTKVAAK